MSELQRSSTPTESIPNDDDEPQSRPALPARPSASALESLLFSSITSPDETSFSRLSRKPILPHRSSRKSLDKRSYSPIQMRDIPDGGREQQVYITKEKRSKEFLESGHLPPKAFYKTHFFFSWDLGYWRQPARHGSIFAILFLCTFLPGWYSQYGFTTIIQDAAIEPFKFDCAVSSGWSFVGIDLKLPKKFTFGEAKAIDLAWNWVIGRGLQGILTLLAYRVFSDALLRMVELTAIPFEMYAMLALPSTKIELLWHLCKNLFRRGNWRVKMILFWLIISTIYLIAVPGLMDAATAYESSYATNFLWPSGQLVGVDKFKEWETDPSIVELKKNVCLRYHFNSPLYHTSTSFSNADAQKKYNITSVTYTLSANVSECSTRKCVTGNECDVETNEATYYDWKDADVKKAWQDKLEERPLDALSPSQWTSWDFPPVSRKSFQCIVEDQKYLWGFSFEWLFLITMINSVWLWGLWILWLDCDTNSELCRKGRRLGTWRAIIDLSEAMREELGPNICAYSDDDLLLALRKRGNVKYYESQGTVDGEPGHLGLSTRTSGRFVVRWGREYGVEGSGVDEVDEVDDREKRVKEKEKGD